MIQPTDLRRGMVLDMDGQLMQVVEYQSFKIAMRGNLVKMKLKNIKSGAVVELSPMSPHDRRIVHMAIASIPGLSSRSEGEGEDRHILVVPEAAGAAPAE